MVLMGKMATGRMESLEMVEVLGNAYEHPIILLEGTLNGKNHSF